MYSELKATEMIFLVASKKVWGFRQIVVAFSEYVNFNMVIQQV